MPNPKHAEMIAYLKGRLAHKEPGLVIIECNGIGYEAKISLNTFGQLPKDEAVKLHTYLMIKEDAHTLYGFLENSEKQLFMQLIGISGVGGNTALTILSSVSASEFSSIIASEDVAALKKIKGIGAKTAGRIILELKGKLKLDESEAGVSATPAGKLKEEAIAALTGLGFPKASMEKRVDEILRSSDEDLTVENIIKIALKGG